MQDTWENSVYRCQVCMCIFSGDITVNKSTAFVICDNVHSLCMECLGIISKQDSARCPTCRLDLKKNTHCNRDLTTIISKLSMQCGSCSSVKHMTFLQAQQHMSDCPDNIVCCPMLLGSACQRSKCTSNIPISSLWKHCLTQHGSSSSAQRVNHLNTSIHDNIGTATFSTQIDYEHDNVFFIEINDAIESFKLCLHVTTDAASDSVLLYVRRFFPVELMRLERIVVSWESGQTSGLVVCLNDFLAPADFINNIMSAPGAETKVLRLQASLLRQMQDAPDDTCSAVVAVQLVYKNDA